jgi:hypothetical protein
MSTLFWLFAALQAADAATTAYILHRGGRELNPLLRAIMARVGTWPGLLGFKAMILGATAYADYRYPLGWGVYGPLIALQVSALVFNARSLR